jgi:GrpB-like predicted nucleotidyltransferase (UPF0157 family)
MYEHTHEQFVNHILFRDYLRTHAEEAAQYEALKQRLAAEHDDVEAYADAKSDFVRRIIGLAKSAPAP